MSGSQYMGGGAAGSSSGGIQSSAFAPLVDCPHCKVKLVRIRSKQQATFGQIFVKYPNNIKDDPTTCGIIMSKKQYEDVLCNPEQHPIWWKKAILPSCADGGHGSVDPILEFKEDFDKIKAKLDNVVNDVLKLKVQVEILKKDCHYCSRVCRCSHWLYSEHNLEVM